MQVGAAVLAVFVPIFVYVLDRQNLKARGKDPSRAWIAAAGVLAIEIVVIVLVRVFLL